MIRADPPGRVDGARAGRWLRTMFAVLAGMLLIAPSAVPAHAAGVSILDSAWCGQPSGNGAHIGVPDNAWHIDRLQVKNVWDRQDAQGRNVTGAGVRVAVIDTGADVKFSPYLTARSPKVGESTEWLPDWQAYDLVGDPNDLQPGKVNCDHGTRVVSLINAQDLPGDDSNFSGIAPNAKVILLRALKTSNQTEDQGPMIRAIDYAISLKVDVINISQAGSHRADLEAAVQRALAAGIIVVASAGNAGPVGPSYPAAYPGVIAVGMTRKTDAPHPSSQADPARMQVTVAAPGDGIVALLPMVRGDGNGFSGTPQNPLELVKTRNAWNAQEGTSFAAPIVTGVVALMVQNELAAGRTLTPAEAQRRLETTADPPPGAVPDPQLGYGLVNPERAVFGPYPAAPSSVPSSAATTPGPLAVPARGDRTPMLIGVGAGLLALLLVLGGVAASEAIPAMRKRRFKPAQDR